MVDDFAVLCVAYPAQQPGAAGGACEFARVDFLASLDFSRNGRPDLLHGKHQMQGAGREFVKVEPLIKRFRFGINGVNEYSSRSNDLGGRGDPIECVFQEGGAKTATLLFSVNRQACKQNNRDRIPRRHLIRDYRRAVLPIDGSDS
jgi:hypothetical protein